jgi:hypothetical protein
LSSHRLVRPVVFVTDVVGRGGRRRLSAIIAPEGAMRILALSVLATPLLCAQTSSEVRRAVTQALPVLEHSAASFVAQRACVSCHHNILPILAFHLAAGRGVPIDEATLTAVEEKTFRQLNGRHALDDAVEATTLSDPTPDDSFLLMAAHAAGLPRDVVTGVYARRLLRWQRDGHWVTSDFRPPHSSSVFTASASAIRAISLYLPEELRADGEAGIRRARQWLTATRPESTEDASFRLLGLVWAGAPRGEIDLARRDLLAFEQPAGGWPQLTDYPADAYSTGEALFALHEAGVAANSSPWRKGLKFLLSTQARDGSWRARTRMLSPASVSPAYFTTGFPYEKDEYLSYAGSCWAAMALLKALPETPVAAPEPVKPQTQDAPEWARTALFGTAQQLANLLEAGLDPNAKSSNGTTLRWLSQMLTSSVSCWLAAPTRRPEPQPAATRLPSRPHIGIVTVR